MPPPRTPMREAPRTGIDPTTARALSHRIAVEQKDSRLPSVAAGVTRKGALVWADARGTLDGRADGAAADADTQYRIGMICAHRLRACVWRWKCCRRMLIPKLSPGSRET